MGPKGAVEILYRSELGDPRRSPSGRGTTRRFANPFVAGEGFHRRGDHAAFDAAPGIAGAGEPADKRLSNPGKKHDNIPL